jgi:hypothetical protein
VPIADASNQEIAPTEYRATRDERGEQEVPLEQSLSRTETGQKSSKQMTSK